jgi:hypothetical protein
MPTAVRAAIEVVTMASEVRILGDGDPGIERAAAEITAVENRPSPQRQQE